MFVCSIAMATKENMQSQRGALYAITQRMTFLASILCRLLLKSSSDAGGSFCVHLTLTVLPEECRMPIGHAGT